MASPIVDYLTGKSHFVSYYLAMTFAWTAHRFSGGALALDVANSVILRFDPARSLDRFAPPEQRAAFVPAALRFCAERTELGPLAPVSPDGTERFFTLRETVDRLFRASVEGADTRHLVADLLEAAAAALRFAASDHALEAATARSALRLLGSDAAAARLKICGHCGWLFIDRSKNRSRIWCDMAVCGNREKAGRHYRRMKEAKP